MRVSSSPASRAANGRRAEIVGWGMAVPRQVMTNEDLAKFVDTSDGWIRERTGIECRHVVSDGETTSRLAIEAARAALQVADANPNDVDLIIVGTSTPDYVFPSTACQVQDALGATRAGAFDLNAACSGFVYALCIGHQAIASGEHDTVLVIGADALTRRVNWQDRSTCVLFGDGAGAVLLRATEEPTGILATLMGADGSGGDVLIIRGGGCAQPLTHEIIDQGLHYVQMDGRQVYRFASSILGQATEQVAQKAGWKAEDISLVIPHQANLRIIESAARRLGLPRERFVVNLSKYGNTSAASVPIALCESIESGAIRPGDHLVLVGFGAGLTWAAAAVKWRLSAADVVSPFYRRWWRTLFYLCAHARSLSRRGIRHLMVLFIRKAERRGGRNGD